MRPLYRPAAGILIYPDPNEEFHQDLESTVIAAPDYLAKQAPRTLKLLVVIDVYLRTKQFKEL